MVGFSSSWNHRFELRKQHRERKTKKDNNLSYSFNFIKLLTLAGASKRVFECFNLTLTYFIIYIYTNKALTMTSNNPNVPTLLRCEHIKGCCSRPKTSPLLCIFFFTFVPMCWVADREHVGWEKEKEDRMEWEKVKEVTTNPGRINCIARLRHFFLCHAGILSLKLHEYMFVFFCFFTLGFLSTWCIHSLVQNIEALNRHYCFLYFICVSSVCNTDWGFVLFHHCSLKSLQIWLFSPA